MEISNLLQVVGAGIAWKGCADLPVGLSIGKSTVINDKVYCGGGFSNTHNDEYNVYCYDPSHENWTSLPPLPVKLFGLGQVNCQLVAVGGMSRSNNRKNEVYTYDKRSKKWKQTSPPMPTARCSLGVLSLESALVVAGGATSNGEYTATVEIFKPDTSQ